MTRSTTNGRLSVCDRGAGQSRTDAEHGDVRRRESGDDHRRSLVRAGGAEIARIDFLLRFTPGAPPVLTAQWETTGDIINVIATPPQVKATAQTIADCPAARRPPAPPKGTPTGRPAAGYLPGRIKLPGQGRFSRIAPGQPLPFGTVVDVSNGRGVSLTDGGKGRLTISGQRDRVPSMVKLVRLPGRVELRLTGGNFERCGTDPREGCAPDMGERRREVSDTRALCVGESRGLVAHHGLLRPHGRAPLGGARSWSRISSRRRTSSSRRRQATRRVRSADGPGPVEIIAR